MGKLCFLITFLFFINASLVGAEDLSDHQNIKKIAKSIIWMTEDYPPYNYLKRIKIKGLSVNLLQEIYANLAIESDQLKLTLYPWARAYKILQKNKHTCLFSMTHTQERAALFNFATLIIGTRISLISLSNNNFDIGEKALEKMRIGVVKDDIGHQLLLKTGMSEKRFVFLATGYEIVQMLALGRVDLIAYGENIAKFQFTKAGILPSEYKVISVLKNYQLGFACNKRVPKAFIDAMQKSLMEVKMKQLENFNALK